MESIAIDVGNIISRKRRGGIPNPIQLLTLAGNVQKIIYSSILVKLNVFKSEFTANNNSRNFSRKLRSDSFRDGVIRFSMSEICENNISIANLQSIREFLILILISEIGGNVNFLPK